MRTRTLVIAALTLAVLIAVAVGAFYGCLRLRERQRINDADHAFRPILHLRCQILSQPIAFHRHCHYVVEFPPDSPLSDANIAELRSLNQLPSRNTLDVTIHTPELTDESLPHLKAIHTFDLLDVTDTSISDNGITELRRTFPDVIIATRGPR